MPVIEQLYNDYLAIAAPSRLDEKARQALRRAFFAGANACCITLTESNRPDLPLPVRFMATQNIVSELTAFQSIEKALKQKPETQS